MIEIALHRGFSKVVASPRVVRGEQGKTVSVRSMHVSQVLT